MRNIYGETKVDQKIEAEDRKNIGIILIGFDHKNTSAKIREEIHHHWNEVFSSSNLDFIKEKVLLSTCYREEGYFCVNEKDRQKLLDVLVPRGLKTYANIVINPLEIFYHLLLVASGADSPSIGEPEIFGQVKEYYFKAQITKNTGRSLEIVFNHVLKYAKKIRTLSCIQKGTLSISKMVYQLVKNEPDCHNGIIIGTGHMARTIARYLKENGVNFIFLGRTKENVERVANTFQTRGEILNKENLCSIIKNSDFIITAISSNEILISGNILDKITTDRSKLFIDIGMPCNISTDIKTIKNIKLIQIDDIKNLIMKEGQEKKLAKKCAECMSREHAERINEVYECMFNLNKKELTIQIVQKAEEIRQHSVNSIKSFDKKTVEQITNLLTHKLIHPLIGTVGAGKYAEDIIQRWLLK